MKQQLNFNPQKAFSGTAESIKNIHRYTRLSKGETIYVRIMAVLMMVIALCLGAVLSLARISADIADNDSKLRLSIETLKQRVTFSDGILDEEHTALRNYIINETALTQLHLLNTPKTEWLNAVNVLMVPDDNAEFYYVKNGREVYKSTNARGLGLSDGELAKLLNERYMSVSDSDIDSLYAAAPLSDGYVVVMYRDIGNYTGLELREHLDNDNIDLNGSGIIIYDKTSGQIYSDGGTVLTDRTIYDPDINPIFDRSIDIDVQDSDYDIFDLVQGWNAYRTYSADFEDHICAVAYYSLKSSYVNVLSDVFLPVAYILLTAFVLVLSASVLRIVRSAARADKEIIHLGKRVGVDKLIIRRELSLFGIAAVIVTLILIYVSVLTDISRQNLEASENLTTIAASEFTAQNNVDNFKSIRNSYLTSELDKAVQLIEANENLRTDEMLKSIADNLTGCTDITVFDQSGVSEASSSGYIGYQYTEKGGSADTESEPDYSSITSYLTEPDENDISYYTVKCRYNSGLIRFTVINDMFKDILSSMGDDAILLEADFGNADVMYYDADNADMLYIAVAGEHKVRSFANELGSDVLHDKYFGIRTISGRRYLLNVAVDPNKEGNFFISALNLKYIFSAIGGIVAYFISCLVVLLIPVLLFFVPFKIVPRDIVSIRQSDIQDDIQDGIYSAADAGDAQISDNAAETAGKDDIDEGAYGTAREDAAQANEKLKLYRQGIEFSEHSFVNSVNNITAGCIIMFLAYVIFGVVTGNKTGSLMSYLFSSKWERGINIFALTLCVIIIFGVWALSNLLRRCIKIVSQNAGPSGITAYKLIESFIRFAALIAAIILVLSELGVKTGSLLAGAGLTSAIIGIGAQSTVNNVLAGLFIIFEGNFNVGDIVEINGWVGVIKDISVRTTCIESYGNSRDHRNVRVINNSDFNNIINRSKYPSRAVVDLKFGIGTEEKQITGLFDKNQARLKAALTEPLSDIIYRGVLRYEDAYKIVRFMVSCDEINRVHNETVLTTELGGIFEPEGLILDRYDNTIRFVAPADIYVHNADTKENGGKQ